MKSKSANSLFWWRFSVCCHPENFATMATWRNDFSSSVKCRRQLNVTHLNLFLKLPIWNLFSGNSVLGKADFLVIYPCENCYYAKKSYKSTLHMGAITRKTRKKMFLSIRYHFSNDPRSETLSRYQDAVNTTWTSVTRLVNFHLWCRTAVKLHSHRYMVMPCQHNKSHVSCPEPWS